MSINDNPQHAGIDWKTFALEAHMREQAKVDDTVSFWKRPTVRLLKNVAAGVAIVPVSLFLIVLCARMTAWFRHPLGDPRPIPPATFAMESEVGRAAIYVDKATGARVLCAVGSTCVVLPATSPTSR